jgi:hypothetical protein
MQQPPAQRPGVNFATLSTATKILLIGGLVYFIDTFLAWQRFCVGPFCASANAWGGDVGFLGLLSALAALALVAWEGMQLANVNVNLSMNRAQLSAILAGATVAFGVIKFIICLTSHPGFGAFIGIILLIAIAYGGWMKWQEAQAGRPAGGAVPPAGGTGFSG